MRTLKISFFIFTLQISLFAQNHWFYQNPLPQGNTLHSVQLVSDDVGWAVGDCGTIIKTTDGGITWKSQSIREPYDLYSADFINLNKGFIVGGEINLFYDSGTFLKTTDGGSNWFFQIISTKGLYGISFFDDNNGIAVGKEGTILKTTNSGQNWIS